MKKSINTKYLDIHIFSSFGLGILYIPGWNLHITLLFVSFNFHYPIRIKTYWAVKDFKHKIQKLRVSN